MVLTKDVLLVKKGEFSKVHVENINKSVKISPIHLWILFQVAVSSIIFSKASLEICLFVEFQTAIIIIF